MVSMVYIILYTDGGVRQSLVQGVARSLSPDQRGREVGEM